MRIITASGAPTAVGPYSQAIVSNGFIFCSGQIPINPVTGKIEAEDVRGQADQVLKNITAVLADAGLGLLHVVKATVFLQDMGDFAAMNEVYSLYFGQHKPARSTIQVARLPLDAKVEIEVIASGAELDLVRREY